MTTSLILYKFVFAVSFNCSFFIVWFQTDFLVEYLKIFKINKLKFIDNFFCLSEYEKKLEEDLEVLTYTDYLQKYMNTPSLGKMLGCPYCLGFWLTIFSSTISYFLVSGSIVEITLICPPVYLSSILLYMRLFENNVD